MRCSIEAFSHYCSQGRQPKNGVFQKNRFQPKKRKPLPWKKIKNPQVLTTCGYQFNLVQLSLLFSLLLGLWHQRFTR